jgi:uncharacterized protein (DUF1501 family)
MTDGREARSADDRLQRTTRRHFFEQSWFGLGGVALASLLGEGAAAQGVAPATRPLIGAGSLAAGLHFPPRAKRVIYLFMAGAPSQLDLFDPKPALTKHDGQDIPQEFIEGERFAFIKGTPKLLASPFAFKRHGQCGAEISELLPNLAKVADEIAIVRSMRTTQFNHAPAQIFMNTGHQVIGRPSMGSWLSYGLGSENRDLPAFVVLLSGENNPDGGKSCWGSGFLPTGHQGVEFRSGHDPVLFVSNPEGVDADVRRRSIGAVNDLNRLHLTDAGDPEIQTRIDAYELAYRMQSSVPELTDLAAEPESTYALYGEDAKKPGTFAHTALLARRMVERGVRFIQVYHNNWDHHSNVAGRMPDQCRDVDQACWGLVQDLKSRGLLDETLVIWGGEFGRTIYSQGGLSNENYGRDHHPRCFTMWMAGGGAKGGTIYGETDDFSYNIVKDPVHIRDFHATVLQLLGFDHKRFTYRYQGLDMKLTGVEPARVIKELIA